MDLVSITRPGRSYSPPLAQQRRHLRKHSSGDLSIVEMLPDEMGYDADVEIRPDNYEEVDSESEDAATPSTHWNNVDEELAARMRRLGKEHSTPLKQGSERGRKRRSIEMTADDSLLPDLEVQEVVDGPHLPSPAKRRRKKSRRPNAARSLPRSHNEGSAGPTEEVHNDGTMPWNASTSSKPQWQMQTSRNDDDDDIMDVT